MLFSLFSAEINSSLLLQCIWGSYFLAPLRLILNILFKTFELLFIRLILELEICSEVWLVLLLLFK